MKKIMTFAKNKMRGVALVASSLVVAAMSLGTGGAAYANSYSWNQNSSRVYGNHSRYDSDYRRHSYNNHNNNNRHYTQYRWVYDPFLHRWVLIGYNNRADRWELVRNHDRYNSHNHNRWDSRNGSYWFNN